MLKRLLINANYENNVVSLILDDCRQLVSRFCHVKFKHCSRQANRCADILARMGVEQEPSFISFDCPPVDIRNCLDFDLSGMYSNRLCLELNVAL